MTRIKPIDEGGKSSNPADGKYAIVVATKGEGIDVVLHGLFAERAERIAARKNRDRRGKTAVHAVPERQLRGAAYLQRR